MRKGIATVSISGVLADKLDAIARAGFDDIELFDNDLIGSPMSPKQVAARCADLGLGIALFQPVRDVEGVAPDRFDDVLHRLRTKLDVMAELGTTTLLACSNAGPDAVGDLDLTAEQLHRVGEVAAESGVTVAFEALAWGRHINRLGQAWEAVQRADHPAITLAVDTFHLLARGDDGTALAHVSGKPHRVPAGGGCTTPRHEPARVEPPLPVLPGSGDARRHRSRRRHSRGGIPGAPLARGVQRCRARDGSVRHRAGRDALAAVSRGPAGERRTHC